MSAQELVYLTLREAADRVRQRQVSPVELLDAVLTRTSALEPQINAYITPLFDQARGAARQAEQEITAGQYRGPLHGIPIALKDNYWTQGVKTTAGSNSWRTSSRRKTPPWWRSCARREPSSPGKCNMHELALGGSSTNAHYGAVHNPWRLDRVPGGSSGGSAAAVAAGFCYAATGTDTAGSIRRAGRLLWVGRPEGNVWPREHSRRRPAELEL